MSSIYKDLCGKISYDTYYKIDKKLICFDVVFSLFSVLTKQNFLFEYPNNFIVLSIVALLFFKDNSFGHLYTMDVSEIRDLYEHFLKEYNKLNKVFNLSNPIEISTMFNYLVYKGYLSQNKSFKFGDDNTIDINGFFGADIFSGNSVCRHISSMLTDILNDYGFESNQLCVYSKKHCYNIKFTPDFIKPREELLDFVRAHCVDESAYQELSFIIDSALEHNYGVTFFESVQDETNFLKMLHGNHAITYTVYNNKNYFLDPSQNRVYKRSDSNKKLLYDDEREMFIRFWSTFSLNGFSKFMGINKNLMCGNSNVDDEEIYNMVNYTNQLCNDNIDIFEKFYRCNKDFYGEINSKMLRL